MKKEAIVEILKKLNSEVEGRYKASLVGLFGSFARGEEGRSSDVDILVDFKENADLIDCLGLSIFLEEKLGSKVDIVPRDTLRSEIRENVLKETVYL